MLTLAECPFTELRQSYFWIAIRNPIVYELELLARKKVAQKASQEIQFFQKENRDTFSSALFAGSDLIKVSKVEKGKIGNIP